MVERKERVKLEPDEQLQQFLAVGNPDIVAAFADSLDRSSIEQIAAISQRLQAIRAAKEEQ